MENFFVDLSHLDLLAVKGEDSGKFLQGQLTCDVEAAAPSRALPGAICNNKGRVLGSFLLVPVGEDYYLEMKPGMLPANKANLDKYIVFYKARTADAGLDFRRLGLVGPEAARVLGDHFSSLPEQQGQILEHEGHRLILRDAGDDGLPARFELWLSEGGDAIAEQIGASLPRGEPADWELQELRRGVYHLEPRHAGEFTPQALNYDQKGFVSFKKGCYTGQEIVARLHYRGNAKRRALPVRVAPSAALDTATDLKVLDADSGKRAGVVLRLVPAGEGSYEGVAELDLDKVESAVPLTLEDGSRLEAAAG